MNNSQKLSSAFAIPKLIVLFNLFLFVGLVENPFYYGPDPFYVYSIVGVSFIWTVGTLILTFLLQDYLKPEKVDFGAQYDYSRLCQLSLITFSLLSGLVIFALIRKDIFLEHLFSESTLTIFTSLVFGACIYSLILESLLYINIHQKIVKY